MKTLEDVLKELKTDTMPSSHWRDNTRIRVFNTLPTHTPKTWYRKPRIWAFALASTVACMVLSLLFSQSALPGNFLYPVKVLGERFAITAAPTKNLKTDAATTIISHRVDEIEKSTTEQERSTSIKNFNTAVDDLEKRTDVSQDNIKSEIEKHKEFLNNDDSEQSNEHESEDVKGASKTHRQDD